MADYLRPLPVGTRFRLVLSPDEEAPILTVTHYAQDRMYFAAEGEPRRQQWMYRGAVGLARLDGVLVEVTDAPAP